MQSFLSIILKQRVFFFLSKNYLYWVEWKNLTNKALFLFLGHRPAAKDSKDWQRTHKTFYNKNIRNKQFLLGTGRMRNKNLKNSAVVICITLKGTRHLQFCILNQQRMKKKSSSLKSLNLLRGLFIFILYT